MRIQGLLFQMNELEKKPSENQNYYRRRHKDRLKKTLNIQLAIKQRLKRNLEGKNIVHNNYYYDSVEQFIYFKNRKTMKTVYAKKYFQ